MTKLKITVSIVGGSGYGGGELLRLLLSHPHVEVKQATSKRYASEPVTLVHPNLRGLTDLRFCAFQELTKCDLLFVALPNGQSMKHIGTWKHLAKKVIDLGADFRLHQPLMFEKWYGVKHTAPQFCSRSVYGLAELHRPKLKKADYIACGGCEATAIILALYPLVKEKLITGPTIADVKIGSSGSGSQAKASSHHPERHSVLRSYKPTHHRHQPEISQELGVSVAVSATAVDLVRGILATIHTYLKKGVTEKDVWQSYRRVYQNELFIRLVKQTRGLYRYPEPKLLWGTNFCDIGFELDPDSNRLVVLSAIDNLVKGTAGQAIQAMNIMSGFPETMGLEFTGLHPV